MAGKQSNEKLPSLIWGVPGFGAATMTLVLFSVVVNLLVLALPIYTLQLFDRVLGSRSTDTLVLLTVAVGIALVTHVAIDGVRLRVLQRLSARFESYHVDRVLQATLVRSAREGEATAQPMRDLAELKQTIASPVAITLLDTPWVPFFLIATFVLHPLIGYLTLVGMIALFLLALAHAWYMNRTHSQLNAEAVHAFEDMQDYADHADVLVAMGMRDAVCAKWRQHTQSMLTRQIVLNQNSSAVQSISKLARMSLQVGVMAIGCYLVLKLEMTAGAMIAASIIMARALAPAEQSISSWKTLSSAREAHKRLSEVLSGDSITRPSIPADRISGTVSFDRVSFSRAGLPRPIIQPLSFEIEAGSAVGVIGPSGSGKSTLARLLVGVLEPTTGYIRLDDIDVTRRSVFDLGPHIGYLPQEVQLFHGTVTENIARLSDADPDQVRQAARLAGVEALINRLPDGYETVIGRSGVRLSGGQQQRIGLARAVFGGPSLLVLDEPDSSLDPEGIDQLLFAVRRMKDHGSTIVLISHRPQLLTVTNRIMLLRDGRLEADGPRDEVLTHIGLRIGPAETEKLPPAQKPTLAALNKMPEGLEDRPSDILPEEHLQKHSSSAAGAVPIAAWPESLKAKWQHAFQTGKLPSDGQSRRSFAIMLGHWLAFTRRHGIDPDSTLDITQVNAVITAITAIEEPVPLENRVDILVRVLKALDLHNSAVAIEFAVSMALQKRSESA